ncbi:hypothetical protein FNV43_RR21307 [Rhamnella rubrinervis]|uniref:Cytochrome P450 n=1 Tax=Rhamnella rubrinervis TaxID=2594499 RepID=A0A8K0E2W1_9ROSA|nr:hypothetical protein FNV43_RR21307 [Rhamnella rubrinervis]
MSIRLGTIPAIVVSSPKVASLFLMTHDTHFASRPRIETSDYLSYGSKGMAFAEYGPYWRNVRKLCTSKLLSASKTESFAALRKEEIASLVQSLKKSAMAGEAVDRSWKIGEAVEDIAKMMILGRIKDDKSSRFKMAWPCVLETKSRQRHWIVKAIEKSQQANRSNTIEKVIAEHELDSTNDQHRDFVDVLLLLKNKPLNPQDEDVYMIDQTNIKAILIDLISAAFDTSATAVEWTISELLRNPRLMEKLQEEVQSVIDMERIVEERDLGMLSYLNMVVKESLRLHPIAPLLAPRECREDITIEGYWIQKKSRKIVNTWAIGQDQNVWPNNVEEVYPERFMERDIDVLGPDFELYHLGLVEECALECNRA